MEIEVLRTRYGDEFVGHVLALLSSGQECQIGVESDSRGAKDTSGSTMLTVLYDYVAGLVGNLDSVASLKWTSFIDVSADFMKAMEQYGVLTLELAEATASTIGALVCSFSKLVSTIVAKVAALVGYKFPALLVAQLSACYRFVGQASATVLAWIKRAVSLFARVYDAITSLLARSLVWAGGIVGEVWQSFTTLPNRIKEMALYRRAHYALYRIAFFSISMPQRIQMNKRRADIALQEWSSAAASGVRDSLLSLSTTLPLLVERARGLFDAFLRLPYMAEIGGFVKFAFTLSAMASNLAAAPSILLPRLLMNVTLKTITQVGHFLERMMRDSATVTLVDGEPYDKLVKRTATLLVETPGEPQKESAALREALDALSAREEAINVRLSTVQDEMPAMAMERAWSYAGVLARLAVGDELSDTEKRVFSDVMGEDLDTLFEHILQERRALERALGAALKTRRRRRQESGAVGVEFLSQPLDANSGALALDDEDDDDDDEVVDYTQYGVVDASQMITYSRNDVATLSTYSHSAIDNQRAQLLMRISADPYVSDTMTREELSLYLGQVKS
jgi:hypothetical protein